MNIDQEIEQIELSIQEAQKEVAMRDAVLRLTENKDFKDIIDDGYFMNEASRLVILRADPNMQDDRMQKQINDQITAIGNFRQYLSTTIQRGNMAEYAISDSQDEREQLLAEAV